VPEPAEIDGNRFRIAEQESGPHQKQQAGEQNGAYRVNMPQRVEGDPSFPLSGIVTQLIGDKAVRCFVKRHGEDNR
jgi:hypothetical protein